MKITTVKLRMSTKSALRRFISENESYDAAIRRLISKIRNKNLKNELIEGYKKMGKADLKTLEDWENASKELN